METEERLPGDGERKIKRAQEHETESWRDLRHEQNREHGTGSANEMEKGVAGVQPAKRRQDEPGVLAQLRPRRFQELRQRQNATGADQTIGLHPKGEKRDQVNRPERAQEPTPGSEISWLPDIVAPKQFGHAVRQFAMAGDEAVAQFRGGGEAGNMIVAPAIERLSACA